MQPLTSVGLLFRSSLPEQAGYLRPHTLNEALEALEKYGDRAKVYAGGTDLLMDMRLKGIKDKVIIDVKGIRELKGVSYDTEYISIGAATTISELLNDSNISTKLPLLHLSMKNFADFSIRSRATIGGNIVNASPAADTPLALLAYNATVELYSLRGKREVPLTQFFVNVKKTVIRPEELLVRIKVPYPPQGSVVQYYRYTRSVEDLMIVGIAGIASYIEDSEKRTLKLSYGAVAPTPVLVDFTEIVRGAEKIKENKLEEIVKKALSSISPISDVRASKEYRMHLVEVGTKKMVRELMRGVLE